MAKVNFFFKRKEFDSHRIWRPLYIYLGYYRKNNKEYEKQIGECHPLSLYFGKDEIAIFYTKQNGEVLKIFSLYVAEGYLNQEMLSKKIEDYALMPLWPLSQGILEDELDELRIDSELLKTGFFSSYYCLAFDGDSFSRVNLPESRKNLIHFENEKKIMFRYWMYGDTEKKGKEDCWEITECGEIKPTKINFSKILLDFLFEIDIANTFEDENFFKLQPHIQNNIVLDALSKKCSYLKELYKKQDFQQKTHKLNLPKPFIDAEREWLNVCRLQIYKPIFISPHRLFDDPEEEVKNIFFRSTIGQGKKDRRYYLKDKAGAELKNDVCTFFMRKYDIWSAFRIIAPGWGLILFPLLLLFIPLGDYFFSSDDGLGLYPAGISTIALPIGMVGFMISHNFLKGINLFKLLLPRLFLGIMLGWTLFRNTEELWKMALRASADKILIIDCIILLIIFLYIYTDIGNHMYRKKDLKVLFKSLSLMAMAILLSFVMGFYVVQFTAKPMLENSGFLRNKMHYINKYDLPESPLYLDDFFSNDNLKKERKYFIGKLENYNDKPIYKVFSDGKIRYIWSILFSQFILAILIGIILQMIWEDRPITEPL